MENITNLLLLGIALSLALSGCGARPAVVPTLVSTSVPPAFTPISSIPTIVPIPIGKTIIVTSDKDNGPGTLRQIIQEAYPGDIIEFDTIIFPLDQPKVIYLQSMLPLEQGNLTIDATHAGVILDGIKIPDGWVSAIQIFSDNNTICGFQVRNFPSGGIYIDNGQNNLIQDNVIGGVSDGDGVILGGPETSNNIVTGNYIGVWANGVTPIPNSNNGISVGEGAHDNQIGPDNIIAFNDQFGILIWDSNNLGNTITQNSIHDNGWGGISLFDSNNNLSAPIIIDFDLAVGTLSGTACANCTVEIFSDNSYQGAIYEGQTKADENGMFAFDNNTAFTGPYLTTIATDT